MMDYINDITETIEDYPVKSLRWLPIDNIVVGLVKDPIFGNPNLHDGYVSCTWNKFGKPLKSNKGRIEMKLKIIYKD